MLEPVLDDQRRELRGAFEALLLPCTSAVRMSSAFKHGKGCARISLAGTAWRVGSPQQPVQLTQLIHIT